MKRFTMSSLIVVLCLSVSGYAKDKATAEAAKEINVVKEASTAKATAQTTTQQATPKPISDSMGWEVTTNVLGYSLGPIASGAYDMQMVDFNLAGLYSLASEHAIGIEPTYFSLTPTSKAQMTTLVGGASDFKVKGFGFSPVYRWYEAGFDQSTAVFGLRIPVKFLTLNTTQSGTGVTGETNFTLIQVLAEFGYRFKWDNITLTPGAFMGYRIVSLNPSFTVGNVAYNVGSNANVFLNGLGYGAQLSLGVAF